MTWDGISYYGLARVGMGYIGLTWASTITTNQNQLGISCHNLKVVKFGKFINTINSCILLSIEGLASAKF
jgi:hypothetical protein